MATHNIKYALSESADISSKPLIAAIGMFDGVHLGHQYVVNQLCDEAKKINGEPVIITFANHPLSIIRPERTPPLITDTEKRIDLLQKAGVKNIVILPFTEQLRQLSAYEFSNIILKESFGINYLLLGYDNGFGADKLKGVEVYRNLLRPLGITVLEGLPNPIVKVSSTMIRKAVANGEMDSARELLGRPFAISGTVIEGKQLGRKLGFPTANLKIAENMLIPKPGVYAGSYCSMPAMINIGKAPTVNKNDNITPLIEAHIITDKKDPEWMDLYGKSIEFDVLKRLRDEQQFSGLSELREALKKDYKETISVFEEKHS